MDMYGDSVKAVYGRMDAKLPYEQAKSSMSMAYILAREYAKAAVDAYVRSTNG